MEKVRKIKISAVLEERALLQWAYGRVREPKLHARI